MAKEYTNFSVKDISRGIDQRSAPSAIPEGYAQVLQNVDTNSSGFLSKRAGYEGYYGYLPVRVASVVQEGTEIRLLLGEGIDTTGLASTPIIVQGRLSSTQDGDWSSNNNTVFYPTFTTDVPDDLVASVGTITVPQGRHGVTTDDVFIQFLLATAPGESTEWVIPDEVRLPSTAPHDIVVNFTLPQDERGYILVKDKSMTGGGFVSEHIISGSSSDTIVIPAGTHVLSNFNILVQVYVDDSGDWVQAEPDAARVNFLTGEVQVDITNSSASSLDVKVVLSAAPVPNFLSASVAGNSSETFKLLDTEGFFIFNLFQVIGNDRVKILPDAVSFNDVTKEISVSVVNSSPSAQSYIFVYEFAPVTSYAIIVEDSNAVSASYTDIDPQLTVWGLNHTDIYTTTNSNEGHVTHIDTYKREGEERAVAGLGGNIFAARTREEVGSEYLIPFSDVVWTERSGADVVLGPLFEPLTALELRTRGNVQASNIQGNRASISGCELVSTGVVKYFLDLEGKSGLLTASVETAPERADVIHVSGMSHKINNGSFVILDVDDTDDSITVSNPAAFSPMFDETGVLARGGVFTDQLQLVSDAKYLVGDVITAAPLDTINAEVVKVNQDILVVEGITTQLSVPTGLQLFGRRTAQVIPLLSSENMLRGDMCELINPGPSTVGGTVSIASGRALARKVRVLHTTLDDVDAASVEVINGLVEVITTSPHKLQESHKFLLNQTGADSLDGEYEVVQFLSDDRFVAQPLTTSPVPGLSVSAGVIVGNTVTLDEPVEIMDVSVGKTELRVEGRWIPAEIPESQDDLPKTTKPYTFNSLSNTDQDILRSTIVADTMFFANQRDDIYKFDGTNIYKAGLIPWQPSVFSTIDTSTASIPLSGVSTSVSAVSGNRFTVAAGTAAQFLLGRRIVHTDDNAVYTVQSIDVDNNYVFVTSSVSGTGGNIREVVEYRYYFRLNAIDRNNNIIASAATNPLDTRIELSAAGQIVHKLIGLPEWGPLDYDRIDVEVYRTTAGAPGPFYLIRIADVNFNVEEGYITIRDGAIDETLTTLDSVMTTLKGAELGVSWTNPPRAKYVTSANNRLILGNLRGYPEVDFTLRKNPNVVTVTAADMAGKRVGVRKDSGDTGTDTNMVDRVFFEFVNSGAETIDPTSDITIDADGFTIDSTAHGLDAGDWVYLFHAAAGVDKLLSLAGWWQIAEVTANDFTIAVPGLGITPGSDDVNRYVAATASSDVPVWVGTDGNYNVAGSQSVDEGTIMKRLAKAVNVVMRMTNVEITGQEEFSPYVVAESSSTLGFGRMLLSSPRAQRETFSLLLPDPPSSGVWFVNGIVRAASRAEAARTRLLNSRIAISYENYPEIFDNPTGDPLDSDSTVDVNSADGQEITGIIPFFGDSVFGSGLAEGFVVVFKTNSVYLLNIETREVSRLQTRGQGCTAPFSIAQTRDGIMFANESGIYRLNRDMSMSYVGNNVERIWQDKVNKAQISKAYGHHYGIGRRYKLSIPVGNGQRTNNEVLVYDHQREDFDGRTVMAQDYGAWTLYTNHNATGWANLSRDAIFGTTDGQVFKIRNAGDLTDFRDDANAVDTMVMELRPEDFGVSGIRKTVSNITSSFQLRRSDMKGTKLEIIPDNSGTTYDAGTFTLTKRDVEDEVVTVKSALPVRKMVYTTLRYTNSIKDEDVVLAGVDFRVAGLGAEGVKQKEDNK